MDVTFWDRLQRLLSVHKITQAELTKHLNLSPSFLSASIRKNSSPRADFVLQVANYFKTSVQWLLTGEDDEAIDVKYAVAIKNKRIMEIAYLLTKCQEDFVTVIENLVIYAASNQKTFAK